MTVFKLEYKAGYSKLEAEVILASTCETALPLITIRVRYPRIIHGEIMTHRIFSRNARSSRAVPVKTMLREIRDTPFIPWHWGKNQKGMQASEECEAFVHMSEHFVASGIGMFSEAIPMPREMAWKHAAEEAANHAEAFDDAGYHKQVVNRLLEPFSFIDVLITSNRWANFDHLRDHPDAEPHIADLARLMKQAIDAAQYQVLEPGEWHQPYITEADIDACFDEDGNQIKDGSAWLNKISAARCARISYKPFAGGDPSYERELERYESLVGNSAVHASPLEHQATPDAVTAEGSWVSSELHGNLPGYIQARKLVDNEAILDGI